MAMLRLVAQSVTVSPIDQHITAHQRLMNPGIDKCGFTKLGFATYSNLLPLLDVQDLENIIHDSLRVPADADIDINTQPYAKAFQSGIDLVLKNHTLSQWISNSPIPLLANYLLSTLTVLVRDQYFEKAPGLPSTPLHQDAYSLPYYCREVVTIWIPLTEVRYNPLIFKLGTHLARSPYPRPNAFDWSEYHEASTFGLQPGDISAHHGWTVHGSRDHCISSKAFGKPHRRAWAITYASATEYELRRCHPYDELMEMSDSNYLGLVRRTRNEILTRKY